MITLVNNNRIEYQDKSGKYYREFKSSEEAKEVFAELKRALSSNVRIKSLLLRKSFSVERPY